MEKQGVVKPGLTPLEKETGNLNDSEKQAGDPANLEKLEDHVTTRAAKQAEGTGDCGSGCGCK